MRSRCKCPKCGKMAVVDTFRMSMSWQKGRVWSSIVACEHCRIIGPEAWESNKHKAAAAAIAAWRPCAKGCGTVDPETY